MPSLPNLQSQPKLQGRWHGQLGIQYPLLHLRLPSLDAHMQITSLSHFACRLLGGAKHCMVWLLRASGQIHHNCSAPRVKETHACCTSALMLHQVHQQGMHACWSSPFPPVFDLLLHQSPQGSKVHHFARAGAEMQLP